MVPGAPNRTACSCTATTPCPDDMPSKPTGMPSRIVNRIRGKNGSCPRAAQEFMQAHGFNSIDEFRGASLPYFTSHHELVRMQREAIAAKKAARVGLAGDADWSGDGFVKEAESMVAN